MKRLPREVLRWVDPALHDLFREAFTARDWCGALSRTSSENRISLCVDLVIAKLIPEQDLPEVLAQAISSGDMLYQERNMLCAMLGQLHQKKRLVFDGEAARAAYDALPAQVTIYRGTTEAEGGGYGICWTLDRERAKWFATKHVRFRNLRSPPVVLSALVQREDICGLLFEREEQDVLVLPQSVAAGVTLMPSDREQTQKEALDGNNQAISAGEAG